MRRKDKDAFDLQRFVEAQDKCYSRVIAELRDGKKRTHWMWYVFPQLAGLGRSSTAAHYAIRNLAEARAYLSHTVLSARLRECIDILLQHKGLSAADVFAYPDDLKFCSSMTLFAHIATDTTLFDDAIVKYCHGQKDERTMTLIRSGMD